MLLRGHIAAGLIDLSIHADAEEKRSGQPLPMLTRTMLHQLRMLSTIIGEVPEGELLTQRPTLYALVKGESSYEPMVELVFSDGVFAETLCDKLRDLGEDFCVRTFVLDELVGVAPGYPDYLAWAVECLSTGEVVGTRILLELSQIRKNEKVGPVPFWHYDPVADDSIPAMQFTVYAENKTQAQNLARVQALALEAAGKWEDPE